jgi:hypothetical protein
VRALAVLLLCLGFSISARAHDGPPFPLLENQRVGPYRLAFWADPDIGTGQIFVILESPNDRALIPPSRVRVAVRPASRRTAEVVYELASQTVRSGARFAGEVRLDRGELFDFRVVVEGSSGGGEAHARVEATPDGVLGPLGTLIYLLPFLGVGYVWARAALRRRNVGRSKPTSAP